MNSYYKFAKVFKTTIINNTSEKIILDSVRIEIFEGERTYKIPFQLDRILLANKNTTISKDIDVHINHGKYIELIARTKESNPDIAKRFCEKEIDQAIATISAIYTPDIFDQLVFQNWILSDTAIMSAWIKTANPIAVDKKIFEDFTNSLIVNLTKDTDLMERFSIMSRFYTKSLLYDPSEEKFLLLWTVLEIFPMKNTSHIKPLCLYLSSIIGHVEKEIVEKLDLGRLYGLRSDLVHNGKFEISLSDMGTFFSKLDDIVLTVLRSFLGLPYDHRLEKYMK